jgi:hypothetical protein
MLQQKANKDNRNGGVVQEKQMDKNDVCMWYLFCWRK